jgi:hypothetical protein
MQAQPYQSTSKARQTARGAKSDDSEVMVCTHKHGQWLLIKVGFMGCIKCNSITEICVFSLHACIGPENADNLAILI